MKTKVIFSIVIVAVALVAASVLFLGEETVIDNTPAASQTSSSEIDANQAQTGVSSLNAIISQNETLECTITYRNETSEEVIEGTFFTRNNMVRGDFLQNDPAIGQVVTSLVIRGEELYLWSEIAGETFGLVAPLESQTDANLPVELDSSVRYNCTPWIRVDDSIFELPTEVLFQDITALNAEYGTVYEEGGEFPF